MKDVNRYALVVRSTQNLLDWVNTVFPDSPIFMDSDEDDEATVYLIPEFMEIKEARAWLRKHFKPILESELVDWCIDSALWPSLTWATFESFLDCRIHSVVLDASGLKGVSKTLRPNLPGLQTSKATGKTRQVPTDVLEIEITLSEIQPKIWRRVLIDPDTTFLELHYIIQFAMGWTNSHLHHFIIGQEDVYIGVPDPESFTEYIDSATVLVSDFLREPNDSSIYEYDFGDLWVHTITLLQRMPRLPGMALPTVIGGARACPPEDCGNTRGYQEMVEILKKPRSKAAKSYTEWLGYVYDPEYFNLLETNNSYFKNFKKVLGEWEAYANS